MPRLLFGILATLLIALAATMPLRADERLYGSWTEIDEPSFQMQMRPDGTGQYLGAEMRWTVAAGRLAFTLGDGIMAMPLEPMDFAFEGGLLRVWHEELYPNPTFWRRTGP